MLLLEKESYLSYIRKVIKKELQTTDPYATILKNRLQKSSNKMISENQSAAIKKNRSILHTLSTIHDIINVPYKLNKKL